MKLKELLDIANQGYPDGWLQEYYDDEGLIKEGSGDTLAKFIVVELTETYDPTLSDQDQCIQAVQVLLQAKQDLSDVLWAIEKSVPEVKH